MEIRFATTEDMVWLHAHDRHVATNELSSLVQRRRILLVEHDGMIVGWLRWNLFWDNTPFMNMLYMLEGYRGCGFGAALVKHWESLMHGQGYDTLLTSTQADETAQHFYRKLGYHDAGALLLPGETTELLFVKKRA